jgi:hypothetical protein
MLFYPILLTVWRKKCSCQIFGNYVHVFWLILRLGILLNSQRLHETEEWILFLYGRVILCSAQKLVTKHATLLYRISHNECCCQLKRPTHWYCVYGLFNDSVSSLDNVVLNNWIIEHLFAIGYRFFKYRSQWAYMTYSRKVGITGIAVKPHKFKVLRTEI